MAVNPLGGLARIWNAMVSKPANPQRGGRFEYIGRNDAGVTVTADTAFQVSAVWACIDCISSAIASSNWDVYEWDVANNKQELLPTDPMQQTLNVRWNPEMTAKAGKTAVMIAAVSWGNGYAEIARDNAGRPIELWPISPDRVEQMRDLDTGELFFKVQNDYGGSVDLNLRDMLHIPGPSMAGLMGDNMIGKAAKTIALSLAMEKFSEAYFGNGTQLGGVLEYPSKLDDPSYERLKTQWDNKHRGPSKAFRTAIIDNGAKWTQIDANADKAQLVESRYQQIEEISRWFRVPPHKIAHLLRSTFNNIEHLGMEFSRDTLRPWKIVIEQEAEYKLFSKRGRPRFVCVDTAWAAEGDFKSRMEGYQIGRAMGVYSPNDVLRKLGENTIGKEGDVRTMNGASVRLEDVGKNMLPTAAPEPTQKTETSTAPNDAPNQDGQAQAYAAWLGSIYARTVKHRDNRQADLQRGGRSDARALAIQQAHEYLDIHIKEILPMLDALAGRSAIDDCHAHAMAALGGMDAMASATELIKKLKGAK